MKNEMVKMDKSNPRYEIIDWLRGIAIIMMVVFHFIYDLKVLDIYHHKIPFLPFRIYNISIVALFYSVVGLSLCVLHTSGVKWNKVKKLSIKLGISSLIITGVTYIAFPFSFVYFGTLHCILAGSLLVLPLIHRPKLCFIICLLVTFFVFYLENEAYYFPIIKGSVSMDHIPIYPFAAWILFGVVLYHFKIHTYSIPIKFLKKRLIILGRHSFVIYLVHQAILYPLLYGVKWLINL
ncbi:DUF1624 domain-containing protein [Bacteriovoracaceae bacterium]|nr:DUF1624 domain-containing protein [Bacteriovoracaceae bacterium]